MTFSSKKLGVKRSYPGIVEADEMDYRRCLEVQMPYLGPVIGTYTDWTPRAPRRSAFGPG